MTTVRIATRGSALALAQAGGIGRAVTEALGRGAELVPLVTEGDRRKEASLAKIGGKGLFVKEIEEALLDGRADLAVHSAKDLPAKTHPGLVLAAFPVRADARDALVARARRTRLAELPQGARVGTGSARRASQLRALRPDLEVVPLRGNVDTRLRKLADRELDAVLLAAAGLERLGLADLIQERIEPDQLLPAVGQGTLALQTRADDPLAAELAALDDAATRARLEAERAFLVALEGDCNVPLAAYAEIDRERVRLRGLVASADGGTVARSEQWAPVAEAHTAGLRAAEEVRAAGGDEILAALRAEASGG
ncbi:MAG: hydroxymethylbilane synthase [Myxococcota bacterium]